ncbi:small multi-drug export protein [Truepera radiovictrix]|uniref:Small multi-drug export protein n=1 Tax=Truepera radiovictrix (strain DSM 17093 / CIP 108686 / LMG 22925 / RQ-24) TaxID=649638 RepID=D7CRU9_TRURR|nr:small multi-drug export protein [Truepera radiovictrix]ADI15277.1 conserved hypothetical protein [Truepera radiovictrix DSM 17093]WMT56172.1 small multi-drug export protein [Truepera radiovictrix]
MDLAAYLGKAATAWFLGFFPFFEIYVAVPSALALGLDPASAVLWPVLGNFAPVPLILFGYEQLMRVGAFRRLLGGRTSARFTHLVERYGAPFVLLITPWIGVWLVAATARALGMARRPLLFYALLSITVYAVVITAGLNLGFEALGG